MSVPRLEVDLEKIFHNARTLVERLAPRGICVEGVTKAVFGAPMIANTLLRAGVQSLGDSRIANIERMRRAGVRAPMTLLRAPMLGEIERVVEHADVSFNTERVTIEKLSVAAQRAERTHGIVLMVELGDLREGIMPRDLEQAVRDTLQLPSLTLEGIGTNLACRSGVVPDANNMSELSELTAAVEATYGVALRVVSGGSSANLTWAGGADLGRVNTLRLGEAILLGREPLYRQPIEGLHTDAFVLVAEVIESKIKPSLPWGQLAQTAFGAQPRPVGRGSVTQTILAIGHQDTDPCGLVAPPVVAVVGASSDHLVVDSGGWRAIGSEMRFQLSYSALLRAMTSDIPVTATANHTNPSGQLNDHHPRCG